MAARFRRVILKPTELSQEQSAQLAVKLRVAIEAQKQVAASSPHVLQYVGGLQEDSESFYVEHEPAEAIALPDLYDTSVPGIDRPILWRITIAVLDALKAGHTLQGKQPVTHGAICPGVLVRDHNGVEKLTDFGFGQAVCEAIGPEGYVNLAVQAGGPGSAHEGATGIWEVLSAYDSGRDDRICAFIDPEKHGSQLYRSFERGSDMVSAGILFYLLSEHRHPYFYNEPEAARSPELAEAMSYGSPVPFNTLRDDLRDSDDPDVKIWRELLWEMMDRIPQGRPSAADTVKRLVSVGIQPVEEQDVSGRRLETLAQRMAEADCAELSRGTVADDFARLAETRDAPAELSDAARALGQLAGSLKGLAEDGWLAAAKTFLQRPAPAGLPGGVQAAVESLRRRISTSVEIQQALEKIEAMLARGAKLSSAESDAAIQAFQDQAQRLKQLRHPPPALTSFADGLWRVLARRRAEADPAIDSLRAQADEWLAGLDELAAAEQWDRLEEQLQRRAELPAWLLDLDDRVERFQQVIRWQRLKQVERSKLREELRQQIQQASQLLGNRDLAGAKALLEPVMQQSTLSDLADQARTLYTRAAEQEASIQAQQEKQQQARQRAEGLLNTVEATLEQPLRLLDEPSLSQAEEVIAEVVEISELPEALRARAREAGQKAERLREELIRLADENIRQLERQEQDLAKAATELEQGHLAKARLSAELLMRSEFANIVEAAQELLAKIDAALGQTRAKLAQRLDEAEQAITSRKWDQAIVAARQVLETEAADLGLRERAEQIARQAEAMRVTAAEARETARTTYEQALSSFEAADLVAARRLTDELLGNPHAEAGLLAAVKQLEAMLVRLEETQALADRGLFPEALRALDGIITGSEPGSRIIEPATLLRQRAKNRQAEVLVAGIRKHLRHRAEKELAAGDSPGRMDSQSSLPDWLRARLNTIDYFMGDRALTTAPEPPRPPLKQGDHLGDKYEILESLGRGGMGEVYRARDLDLDREVALKLTPDVSGTPELDKALENEAKAIARLRHPNIMHINSSGVLEGRRYFDTNYIRGQDLASYTREHLPSQRATVEILIAVAEAMAYAHEHGVLHRDVKPQNIYVGQEPGAGPWLIDFGLAYIRSMTDGRARPGLCGTPGYIAPEVITSMGEQVDQRVDIFALGCVLYELLTGRPPFHELPGSTPKSVLSLAAVSQTLLNTLRWHYKPLDKAAPDVRPELVRICEKAMSEEPQNRYQSASEMAAALASYLKTLDIEEAEADLKQVRARLEERKRNTPDELKDLQETLKLAEGVRHHGISDMQSRAKDLAEEIKAAQKDIANRMAKARKDLRAAAEAHGAGDHQGAINGAQAVLAVPYVVELHAEAKRIIEKAQEGLQLVQQERQRQQKSRQKRTFQMTLMAFVVCGVAGAGVYWFTRPGPPPAKITNGSPSNATHVVDVDPDKPPVTSNQTAQIQPPVNLPPVTTTAVIPPPPPPEVEPPPLPTTNLWPDVRRVMEGAGETSDRASITFAIASGTPDKDVTALIELTSSDAQLDRDYLLDSVQEVKRENGKTIGKLVIPRGEKQTVAVIAAKNNDIDDGTRTVAVSIMSVENADPPPQSELSISIDNDDRAGLVLDCGGPAENLPVEESKTITCRASLQSEPGTPPARLELSTDSKEVTLAPAALEFNATNWKTPRELIITAADDGLIAGPRQVQIQVACTTDDAKYKALKLSPLNLTIQDKDSATIAFSRTADEIPLAEILKHQVPIKLETTKQSKLSVPVEVEVFSQSDPATILGTLQFKQGAEEQNFSFAQGFIVPNGPEGKPALFMAMQLRFAEKSQQQIQAKGLEVRVSNSVYGLTLQQPAVPPPTVPPPPPPVQVSLRTMLPEIAKEMAKAANQQVSSKQWFSPLAVQWEEASDKPDLLAKTLRLDENATPPTLSILLPWGRTLPPMNLPANTTAPDEVAAFVVQQLQEGKVLGDPDQRFLQAWAGRIELEKKLQGLNSGATLDPTQAWGYLNQIAAIKWQSASSSATSSMAAWLQVVQTAFYNQKAGVNSGLRVEPSRYIEFFWGPRNVHALYWLTTQTQGGAEAPTVQSIKYLRLGNSREVQKLVADLLNDASDASAKKSLGEKVLTPIVKESGFFRTDAKSTSFGVALAPDGPLCFLPLAHLPFHAADTPTIYTLRCEPNLPRPPLTPVQVRTIIGAFSKLADLCDSTSADFAVSVWTMVSLGPGPTTYDANKYILPLWGSWWGAVTDGKQNLGQSSFGNTDPKINNATLVFGPESTPINAQVRKVIADATPNWKKFRSFAPREVDGGFLNPRLELFGVLPGLTKFCVIVTDPISAR